MAGTISVVLSQSPARSSQRQAFEQSLVEGLLMEDDTEVHVIAHVEDLQGDDSSLLCLEGITAHLVLLSWLPPLAAYEALQQYRVAGRFGRTEQTGESPPAADQVHPRTIYCLDLAEFSTPQQCRAEIQRIGREQAVEVFSIGGGLGGARPPAPAKAAPQSARPADPSPATAPAESAAPAASPPPAMDEEAEEARLDELVDELDDLDI